MSNLTDFIGHNIIRSATEPTDKTKFWFNETDFKLHYYDYTNLAWVETTKQYITPTISVFDIFVILEVLITEYLVVVQHFPMVSMVNV